jgi:hypothetical protein
MSAAMFIVTFSRRPPMHLIVTPNISQTYFLYVFVWVSGNMCVKVESTGQL